MMAQLQLGVISTAGSQQSQDDEQALSLHKAVEDNDIEKVKQILQNPRIAAKTILVKKEPHQEIPLHLACKHEENNDIVKALLGFSGGADGVDYRQQQLEAKEKHFGNTPLHTAAYAGNTGAVEMILRYIETESLLEKNNQRDTPVHYAAREGHVKILELMYERSKGCIKEKGSFEGLPLHSACGYGRVEVVTKLLKWYREGLECGSVPLIVPPNSIETRDEKKLERKSNPFYTPLTRACQFGRAEVVEVLLRNGAKRFKIALIKAIEGKHNECVKLLLFGKKFHEDLLKSTYRQYGSLVWTTPFRELIKHMPDVAEKILHKCVRFRRFAINSTLLEIELNYQFVDDDAKIIYEPCEALDYYEDSTDSDESDIGTSKKISFNKEALPLSLMKKYRREELLTHPVVAALIHDKWKSIYGVLSFLQWFLNLCFMCCTISLVFTLPNPSSSYCKSGIVNYSQQEGNISCSGAINMECDDVAFKPNVSAIFFLVIVVILYSFYRIGLEAFQLCYSIKLAYHCKKEHCLDYIKEVSYLWNPINWVEVPLFILSAIFSFTVAVSITFEKPLCPMAWQWEIGIVTLWLSWIEFIFLSTQFKIIGVHALMFLRVLKTLIKFIPLAFLMIVAFGLTFHLLLYQPELKASPFFTPGFSLLKTLSMTAGDVGADDFFALDINGQIRNTSHLQYVRLSTTIWLLSLILMTIILSNLLIGLAVGDIATILHDAKIERLALQVDFILTVESCVNTCTSCKRRKSHDNKHIKTFKPNKKSIPEILMDEIVYLLWGGVRYDSKESVQRLVAFYDSETETVQKEKNNR